ncbi:hypothetical protein Tco_0058690 [Tanacetum coccineum]
MIDRDKIMVDAGGNIMQKTPQEAYDLIKNMTQHHYQWDSEVQYDTTTDISAHYSKTTFTSSKQVEVLGNDTRYTIQSVQHQPGPVATPLLLLILLLGLLPHLLLLLGIVIFSWKRPTLFLLLIRYLLEFAKGDILFLEKLLNIKSTKDLPPQELNNDSEGDILFLEKLLKNEPSEAKKSEIYPFIGEPSDTFLMGVEEFKFNPLKDIDDPVPIPMVSEKPLDLLTRFVEYLNTLRMEIVRSSASTNKREPSDTFLMGVKEIKFNPLKDTDDPVPIPKVYEKPLDSLDLIYRIS